MAEHGYAALSMRQIARPVGCSVGPAGVRIEDPVERLEAFCRSYVRFAMTYPEQYKAMYLELNLAPSEAPDAYRRAQKPLHDTAEALAEALARGTLHASDPMEGASFVWAALHGMLSLVLARQVSPKADPDRLADLTIQHTLDSFRCPPRRRREAPPPRPTASGSAGANTIGHPFGRHCGRP